MNHINTHKWMAAVESTLGIPFRHMGRNEHGVDCYGMLILAAERAGLAEPELYNVKGYRRSPGFDVLAAQIGKFLEQRPYNRLHGLRHQAEIGDILVFRIDNENIPRHMAVYCGPDRHGDNLDYMIHADAYARKVTKTMICPTKWVPKITSVWYSKRIIG